MKILAKLGAILTVNSDPREFGNSYNNLIHSSDVNCIKDKALLAKIKK
jgi:hypothetical protein